VGSITKPVVAALVLGAVERGELTLDDPVASHLPGAVRDGDRITVRMLLQHTSGIFDVGNEGDVLADVERLAGPDMRARARRLLEGYRAGRDVVVPDRVIVALAETHPRYFRPGAGHHYSNVNYELAGMVLERATGRSLAELLADRVVRPLGLTSTSLAPADRSTPELHGYRGGVDVTDDLTTFGNGGHGGIVSTPDELLDVLVGTLVGKLVRPALVTELLATTAQSRGSYGLGMVAFDLRCGTFHGHGGAVNGTSSLALVDPQTTRGVVVAVNVQPDDLDLLPWAERLLCG
jgi:D-alanyl-D-alanine carboxypeptidase